MIYTPENTELSVDDKLKITRRFARVTEQLSDKGEIIELKKMTESKTERFPLLHYYASIPLVQDFVS